MIIPENKGQSGKKLLAPFLMVLLSFAVSLSAQAQEDPPVPVTVTPVIQSITFGNLSPDPSGGSVTIDAGTGVRSSINVVLLGGSYSRAEYEVEGNPGTLVQLSYSANFTLNREGGGGSIDMSVEVSPPDFFVLQAFPPPNKLYIGGTLSISASTPAGSYKTEDFQITLNLP